MNQLELPQSILTRSQKKTITKHYFENGDPVTLVVKIRYDDECKNGHNSFAITGSLFEKYKNPGEAKIKHSSGAILWQSSGGCIHDEIAKHCPEVAKYIKWHLTSSDGPLHYIANTKYHAQSGKLDYARSSAIWPEATYEQLTSDKELADRLPALMEEFKKDMIELGFIY